MGFKRRKMEDQRRESAEKEAANRRATDAQVIFGAGFVNVPGTDACIKIGGNVTVEGTAKQGR